MNLKAPLFLIAKECLTTNLLRLTALVGCQSGYWYLPRILEGKRLIQIVLDD